MASDPEVHLGDVLLRVTSPGANTLAYLSLEEFFHDVDGPCLVLELDLGVRRHFNNANSRTVIIFIFAFSDFTLLTLLSSEKLTKVLVLRVEDLVVNLWLYSAACLGLKFGFL